MRGTRLPGLLLQQVLLRCQTVFLLEYFYQIARVAKTAQLGNFRLAFSVLQQMDGMLQPTGAQVSMERDTGLTLE